MHVDHHDLDHEFPKLHDVIEELKAHNEKFRTMVDEYDRLTGEVENLEENGLPVGDLAIEEMKQLRVRLKDRIYHMAIGYRAGRASA